MTAPPCITNMNNGIYSTQVHSDPFFWRERWRQLKLAHCAVPNYGNAKEFWTDKKRIQTVYMKDHATRKQSDTARLDAMKIPDGCRVLDIGAGPGIYAVPLAGRGIHSQP